LSRLQPCCDVWRGMRDMRLPESFSVANEHNIRGGVEFGFSSTTFERNVATRFAKQAARDAPAMAIKLRMGMADRGATIDWLSLYPNEKEALWPALLGLEATHESVQGRLKICEMQPKCNLQAWTIEQLLGARREQLAELVELMSREVTKKLAQARAGVDKNTALQASPAALNNACTHLDECGEFWQNFTRAQSHSAEWYNDNDNFVFALKEALEVFEQAMNSKRIDNWVQYIPKGNVCHMKGHVEPVLALALLQEKGLLAAAGEKRPDKGGRAHEIYLWDLALGSLSRRLQGHSDQVDCLLWLPELQLLLSGSRDDSVRAWDASTGQELRKWKAIKPQCIVHLPEHAVVAHNSNKGIEFYNPASAERKGQLQGASFIWTLLWIPELRRLVSGSETLDIWEISGPGSGTAVAQLIGHTKDIRCLAYVPERRLLASGSNDETIRLWNAATMETTGAIRTLDGHAGWITSLLWLPQCNALASGSHDKTVRLWSAEMWTEQRRFTAEDYVNCLQWLPEQQLASAGGSNSNFDISLWQL